MSANVFFMKPVSKEGFLAILECQQKSGLSVKDFCANESYTKLLTLFGNHMQGTRGESSGVVRRCDGQDALLRKPENDENLKKLLPNYWEKEEPGESPVKIQ